MACGRTPGPTCGDQRTTVIDQGTRIQAASPVPGATGKTDSTAGSHKKVAGPCELLLVRTTFTKKSTMGELSLRGRHLFYTLEDVEREKKVYAETAIPVGTYEIKLTQSPTFGTLLPELLNVPNFTDIRIHWGNTAVNTKGCILIGRTKGKDFVGGNTKTSVKELMDLIKPYSDAKAGIRITIRHGKAAESSE